VGHVVLISGIIAVAALLLWYVGFTQYNRRKGIKALHWVEVACIGEGRVVDSRWLGTSRVKAQLRFTRQPIEDASVTVRLRPRPLPLHWALSLWRKQKETLTFEADLDHIPAFNLEVLRHRWFTHNSPPNDETGSHKWTISRPGPVVLTTRTHWNQELTPVVNTLMTSRGHNLISVRFRSKSPHLTATVALDSVSDPQAGAGFLEVVRELAAGASARQ
jgi:hypothetical protein